MNHPKMPTIVCLCGSTRFVDTWKRATRMESLAGRIVLSVGVMIHAGDEPIRDGPHKEFLDVDEYVGDSTMSELRYAKGMGKKIRYWSIEQEQRERGPNG